MASRGEAIIPSELWTVPLPSQTQLNPTSLSTHLWTPRMHSRLHPQQLLTIPKPRSLHISGPVCFWRHTWRRGPQSSWKWVQGHLGGEFQGPQYQKHDPEGLVQALGGCMRNTCLDKGQRGSKEYGPSVLVMQKRLPQKFPHVS